MADISKAISVAVRTGKLNFGFKETIDTLRTGKAKLLIVAGNCPLDKRDKATEYAKMLNVPVLTYNGSSYDLGATCGKKFSISLAVVREPGDSEILNLVNVSK